MRALCARAAFRAVAGRAPFPRRAGVLFALVCVAAGIGQADPSRAQAPAANPPRHELRLSPLEFSFVQDAAQAGMTKFGDAVRFTVRLEALHTRVTWILSSPNPQYLEILDFGLAAQMHDLEATATGDGEDMQQMLHTLRTIRGKIQYARTHRFYEPARIGGTLVHRDSTWLVETDSGAVTLNIENLNSPPRLFVGKTVSATGIVRRAGVLDARSVVENKPNVLDLFVMGLCPAGRSAERGAIEAIRNDPENAPLLDVHYIFYARRGRVRPEFRAMHGEREMTENIVQILIRDEYPEAFENYLLLRADDADSPWQNLAGVAGLGEEAIEEIARRRGEQGYDIVRREYDTVAGAYGVLDRSPTLIWQGRFVRGLSDVAFFAGAGVAPATERCGSGLGAAGN